MKPYLKEKLVIAAIVPAISMSFVAASAFAQSAGMSNPQAQQNQPAQQSASGSGASSGRGQDMQATTLRDMRASKLIGAKVESTQGKEVGEVQDLIVDAGSGQVQYVIVAHGGTLGFNEKLFAYPMNRFRIGSDGEKLVTSASEQEMKNAPGFDKSSWPSFGSGGYSGQLAKHFGQSAKTGGNLVRMSAMLNNKVVDRAGLEVGEVNDVVVGVTDGAVRFVALEPVDDLNMKDRLAVVPMTALRATGDERFEQRQQARVQASQSIQSDDSSAQQAQSSPSQQDQQAQTAQASQDQSLAQNEQRSQDSSSGQSAQGSSAAGGDRQQEQQRAQDQDLKLVLNVPTVQLQQARTLQKDQWPDLNSPGFRSDIDRYVASFGSGSQQRTSGSGATQGQSGAGQDAAATPQTGPSGSAAQESSGTGAGAQTGGGASAAPEPAESGAR